MTSPRTRLVDIAAEAEVSTATVSRVLNGATNVRDATRDKVLSVARDMGLGLQAQQTLGLLVPDASNPFFAQLIHLFERELARHGAQLITASSDGRVDREIELMERFRGLGVDGVFYTPSRSSAGSIVELLSRGSLPVLAFDRSLPAGNLDVVATSPYAATQMLIDYLLNLGHTRFAYIQGAADTTTAQARYDAFCRSLAKNSITLDEDLVFPGNYRFSGGRDAAERYLALPEGDRPTAVLAGNDLMAIGFIQRVHQSGLRVPGDISVAGFDGIEFGEWYSPSLTTIVQPVRRLVRQATELLLSRIAIIHRGEPAPPPQSFTVEPRFVARESTAEVNSPNARRRQFHVIDVVDDNTVE